MNNKLQEQLAKVIEKSISLAEQTGEFIVEQGNDLIQQFYYWEISASILGILLGIILIIMGKYIPYMWITDKTSKGDDSKKYFSRYTPSEWDTTQYTAPAYTVLIVFGIIGGVMLLSNIYDLLQILVAPKLYIIEHFINKI